MREQGWALVDQELATSLRSIAAPVHARDGSTIAAINVASAAASADVDRLRAEFLPSLLTTAERIEESVRLGGVSR